jgi:hypothetical protein
VLRRVFLVATFCACARASAPDKPVPSLAQSTLAAAELAPLREAWEARRLDAAAIEAFLARHGKDRSSALARVYLAFARLEQGQLASADAVLQSVSDLPPGTTNDLATVARAKSLRLHRAPQSALDSLRPLVGKMVDDADREIFLEELALSAIAAHDDYEALAYLDAWLRGVGEDDKERVRGRIAEIMQTFSRQVLEQTYRTMRGRGAASGYGMDTQKLVSERLARIAVDENDAALARWLVEASGTSAADTGGDAGLELGELAASRRGLSMVSGRTVGLLLPTRDRELRDEAADVVRGMSWSLDLPRSSGSTTAVRLVTREDGVDMNGTRSAMEELAGEGAAAVVAGFDRASADRALQWSEDSGISVLLLAAPSRPPRRSAVVLGERTDREIVMLADALVRHGAKTAAFVADTADDEASASVLDARSGLTLLPAVRCDLPLAAAGKTRFPVRGWREAGARAVLIAGPSSCGRDVLRDLAAIASDRPAVALTLEAGVPIDQVPRGVAVIGAAAGVVPILASRSEEVRDDEVRAFMDRFGVRPSYWTALGHDAGILAKGALSTLPLDVTTDARAVMQRRAIVQTGLVATRARLWTTDAKSIGETRVLPRSLRLVTWQKP